MLTVLDYLVVAAFLAVVLGIGFVCAGKIKASRDFFVADGRVPWWLAGVSHHVSGYSGVVFVAYAAIAYQYGFTIYVWWAVSIAIACLVGARMFAPRWARLRVHANVQSPTEYLAARYGVPTQQIMAWCGILLKLFDTGAKWASIGVLLQGFTGLPLTVGIFAAGVVSLLYITLGGLWADLYTDFAQFVVQLLAGVVLFAAVVRHLGGLDSIWGIWSRLPPEHGHPFSGPFTPVFAAGFTLVALLSYNGGSWSLAARYLSAPSAASASRSAVLSGLLYLSWPLVFFFPMWASPLLLPDLADPAHSYILLVQKFLPAGLVGLVVAAMLAATMSMTTSDTNTVAAAITRDILPRWLHRMRDPSERTALVAARLSTFFFTLATLVIAVEADHFGGILGLLISWFAALVGPISIPMLGGLLPAFRTANGVTAMAAIFSGLAAFVVVTYARQSTQAVITTAPILTSGAVFAVLSWLRRRAPVPDVVERMMAALAGSVPPR